MNLTHADYWFIVDCLKVVVGCVLVYTLYRHGRRK